ncbi:hypothetical protein YC2023_004913 [Brassica napus]
MGRGPVALTAPHTRCPGSIKEQLKETNNGESISKTGSQGWIALKITCTFFFHICMILHHPSLFTLIYSLFSSA